MMSNIRALGRLRLAILAVALLMVMVLATGSLFAANEQDNPDMQPVGEWVQLEGVDPGLDAKPPAAGESGATGCRRGIRAGRRSRTRPWSSDTRLGRLRFSI